MILVVCLSVRSCAVEDKSGLRISLFEKILKRALLKAFEKSVVCG